MNFEKYKEWREDILANFEIPAANRFDCLNPFKAMDFTKRWNAPTAPYPLAVEDAMPLWRKLHFSWMPQERSAALHVEATRGVRSALGALFSRLESAGMELWLPEDVYPFYLQEARTKTPNLRVRLFKTIPEIDMGALSAASQNAALLITNPLTPTGGFLTEPQRRALANWADNGANRWTVFDCVYLYQSSLPPLISSRINDRRSIHLFSMSKSWLLRGVFGTIVGPAATPGWWTDLDLVPTDEACTSAIAAMTTDRHMPERQQEVFLAEWNRRAPVLDRFKPVRQTIGHGYFRLIPANFERVLQNDRTLVVPASVFGSKERDWSVVTCLYEAAAFNRH